MRSTMLGVAVALPPVAAALGEITFVGNATQLTSSLATQSDPAVSGDVVVFSDARAGLR